MAKLKMSSGRAALRARITRCERNLMAPAPFGTGASCERLAEHGGKVVADGSVDVLQQPIQALGPWRALVGARSLTATAGLVVIALKKPEVSLNRQRDVKWEIFFRRVFFRSACGILRDPQAVNRKCDPASAGSRKRRSS